MREPYTLSWVTPSLAVGSAPMNYDQLDSLRRQGIQAIMNLCAEFCDLHWIESGEGFEVYYLPIDDEEAPALAELEKALDWLDEELYLGRKVLIHCRHGIGRTGTVLKAYLLRRGLGHKLADRRIKGLRSQPANFDQWWFLRKYGKTQGRLSIREPSLERSQAVDLYPFLADWERVARTVDARLESGGHGEPCGQANDHCCRDLVHMGLAGAVYLHHFVSMTFGRRDREALQARALKGCRALREATRETGGATLGEAVAKAYRAKDILCPLSEMGECQALKQRPLACRLAGVSGELRNEVESWARRELNQCSAGLWLAFAGRMETGGPLRFPLPEVLAGKFVQTFFHRLAGM
ncbi:Dual specificity protein phosphatase [Alkalidesulfovibrio alkalitolerans DSM 16529]|uniref:Dual specificity protein phosphatase n=1 Tax=Alkalidesulfovibrio alkalitolerans DSM 16529 TaxID=1121439 RepID=S7TC15_9BACT|nr:dual specificity protein phosphatase [Alkalidesulfovibrio alkalitolerans]EPR34085.1 Dual specificity protein phosphatase [Alkalidesulfovibrio alkalitolerans DSM 16529]